MDSSYLQRAADKCGLNRDVFMDAKAPTVRSNVHIVPFFGDMYSTSILASLFLKRYKEENKHKYLIVCSWKGFDGLFPYADEYWSFRDSSIAKLLASTAESFRNTSDIESSTIRNLNEFFENVWTYPKNIKKYYNNGFTNEYWREFETVKHFQPNLPSTIPTFAKKAAGFEQKVVLCPEKKIRSWQRGKSCRVLINNIFWNALVERLLEEGILPIIYQNDFTYDLSKEFADRCGYIVNSNILQVLSMVHEVGCAIDIFTGFSRIATLSRCPFVSVNERQLFLETKENEINDLTCSGLPREHIFGFSGQALTGDKDDWNKNLFDIIVKKVKVISSSVSINNLPSAVESYKEVPYELVRGRNSRRMGVRFISIGKRSSK